jgi:hypothetical protein
VRVAWNRGWTWAFGLVGALLVVGPGLAPGGWLNLDLVVTPTVQLPSGIWGLGPALPRRIPLFAIIAWLGAAIGGELAMKLFVLAALTCAFAGAAHLLRGSPAILRVGAGVLYALGPFAVTRVGVGQLTVVAALAILPWAIPSLLVPDRSLARTLLWGVALGLTGFVGGVFALVAIVVGCVASRGRRVVGVSVAATVSQLPWMVPGFVVLVQGASLSGGGAFRTDVGAVDGPFRLASGYGFWLPALQSGRHGGFVIVLIGAVLLALAAYGHSRLPAQYRSRLLALAIIGGGYAYLSSQPFGIDIGGLIDAIPGSSAIREGQRLLPLALVWLAPAVGLGAERLAERARGPAIRAAGTAVPLMLALVLAGPGLWGIDGALSPVRFPASWEAALHATRAAPGPVVALPFNEYLDIGFAGNRRVLNPLPDYLGGDVISSSDPELGSSPEQEQVDAREPRVRALLRPMRAGQAVSTRLAALGVRWVVLLHEVDWKPYRTLADDPGLRRVVDGRSLELYEVRAWRGVVLAKSGRPVPASSVIGPYERVGPSGAATWFRPPADGWMRGTGSAQMTGAGVALPAGRGPVWYWPSLLVVLAYFVTLGGGCFSFFRIRTISRHPHDEILKAADPEG